MNREDLKALPLAATGAAIGFANYFVKPAIVDTARFVVSRLAVRAWSEMPGNPNQGIDNRHHNIGSAATIQYLRTPEEPTDIAA
jgi:hypothetical protein